MNERLIIFRKKKNLIKKFKSGWKRKKVGNTVSTGLPRWYTDKESACNAGDASRQRSDPQVGKIPWRRAWQPTPVYVPGESHGQRSLVGYVPQGHKELDTTEVTEYAHAVSMTVSYDTKIKKLFVYWNDTLHIWKYELYWDTLVGV